MFRHVGGNSDRLCWTLLTLELFALNYINITDRTLSVCFCVFSKEKSTCLNFLSRGLLTSFWSHDQQEPQECAGGVCRLSVFVHGLRRPAEPTGEQNANVSFYDSLHPVNLKKNPLWRLNIQTSSPTGTLAIFTLEFDRRHRN